MDLPPARAGGPPPGALGTAVTRPLPGRDGRAASRCSRGPDFLTISTIPPHRKQVTSGTLLGVFATTQTVAAAPLSITRDDQRDVMVTIYNGNLGLVKDLREVRLPAGTSEAWFMDVAAQ